MIFCLDIGTTGGKAALFSDELRLISLFRRDFVTHLNGTEDQAEHDPMDWWNLFIDGLRATLDEAGARASGIKAIGLSCMTPVVLPIGADGEPIARAQLWYDRRAASLAPELERTLGAGAFERITGSTVKGISFLPKLLWMREHEPEVFARAKTFLQASGFIAQKLTGVSSMDSSHGELTLLVDWQTGGYAGEILRAFDIPRGVLPDIAPAHQTVGGVSPEAAALTGLPAGIPVVSGGHDSALSAYALGVRAPGDACLDVGNAANLVMCTDRAIRCPAADVYRHPEPGRWLFQIYTATAGAAFRWYRDTFGAQERASAEAGGASAYDLLCESAQKSPPGANGVTFLPYLQGAQQCVELNGSLEGLKLGTTKPDVTRAVLEGCAMSVRYNMEQMLSASGGSIASLVLCGGGSKNPVWAQIHADVLGLPLRISPVCDTAILGAAMLAARAVGLPVPECPPTRIVRPDAENRAAYADAYARFKRVFERQMRATKEADES